MNQGPSPDPKALMILKAFALCENFGWSLDELGIPKYEQTQFMDGFIAIIIERNEQIERERKLAELKAKHG